MEITVRRLDRRSDYDWFGELECGEFVFNSAITVQHDGELRSFHIGESMFKDMLALNGLEGEFSKRFFTFISHGEPELPWCFGDQDDEIIERVLNHYKSSSEFVPPRRTT